MDLTPGQDSSLLICKLLLADGRIYLVQAQIYNLLCSHITERAFHHLCYKGKCHTHYCQGQLSKQLVELGAIKPRGGKTKLISHAQAKSACKV